MKLTGDRPYSDPDTTARKLIEIAKSVEAVPGRPDPHRIDQRTVSVRPEGVRRLNTGSSSTLAIERGWLEMHESGTYVKFIQVGAELFA